MAAPLKIPISSRMGVECPPPRNAKSFLKQFPSLDYKAVQEMRFSIDFTLTLVYT